jgi:hypothetical protein
MKVVSSGGRVIAKLFYKQNHVGQSTPRLVHPIAGDHAAYHIIYHGEGYGISQTIYYSPHRSQTGVLDMIKAKLEQIPEWDREGEAGAGLGNDQKYDIERKVQAVHLVQAETELF